MKLTMVTGCLLAFTLAAQADDMRSGSTQLMSSFSLAQKNCTPGDLTIDNNDTAKTVTTNCLWKATTTDDKGNTIKEDSDMQVTLHVADSISMVGVHCTFVPATSAESTKKDFIADVAVSKNGLAKYAPKPMQLPAGSWLSYVTDTASGQTNVYAVVTNYKNVLDQDKIHYQINVIFDLNKNRIESWFPVTFNENDTLQCTFAPNVIPFANAASSS